MPLNRKQLLIVEDDEDILFVLATFFRRAGYRVNTARARSRGLAVMRRAQVDLVIADTGVRGNGNTMAAFSNVPLIMMSGHPSRIAQLRNGTTPFIAKPFQPEELLILVEQLLS